MLDLFAAVALGQLVATTTPACADPAIVAATSKLAGNDGSLNTYDVAITVKNAGRTAQPSSLLQSVNVYQNDTKVDKKGVTPLKPGASQTVHYRLQRASEARENTTHLRFVLTFADPHGAGITNCSTANDSFRLTL